MRRSRWFIPSLAWMLAIGLAACDAAETLGPLTHGSAPDGLGALLAAESRGRQGDTAGGGPALFDRLAGLIPSFGGLYRTGPCSVAVVLVDMSEAERAIQVVQTALGVIRNCGDDLVVTAVQGEFTYVELQRYLHAAQRLLEIRGVRRIHVSYELNRLVVTVATHAAAQAVIEALPSLGIPQAAVVFNS